MAFGNSVLYRKSLVYPKLTTILASTQKIHPRKVGKVGKVVPYRSRSALHFPRLAQSWQVVSLKNVWGMNG